MLPVTLPVTLPVKFPVTLASTVPATNVSEPMVHLSVVSFQIKIVSADVPRSTSIPAFTDGAPD